MLKQPEPIVEIEGLVKNFGNVRALDGLSFAVKTGSICGFLGPNGSGKSTTLRILTSLVRPDNGTVRIFGHSLLSKREDILMRTGVLIERPNFYEHFTARRNLSILMRYSGHAFDKSRVEEVLHLVGLSERADHKVGGFSEGMKQRLGLGQAILGRPELLILDEPFNSLDPQGVRDMRELVKALNQNHGVTVLVSSHNLDEIEKIATDMVLISKGRVIAQGKVADLVAQGHSGVTVETDRPQEACDFLKRNPETSDVQISVNGKLHIDIPRPQIPGVIRLLSQEGFQGLRSDRQPYP